MNDDSPDCCPGCGHNLIDIDGPLTSSSRRSAYGGKGDVCADGQLWCLDCIQAERCACALRPQERA